MISIRVYLILTSCIIFCLTQLFSHLWKRNWNVNSPLKQQEYKGQQPFKLCRKRFWDFLSTERIKAYSIKVEPKKSLTHSTKYINMLLISPKKIKHVQKQRINYKGISNFLVPEGTQVEGKHSQEWKKITKKWLQLKVFNL